METYPVTADRWNDLAQLFKAHGNPNYCWCMTWRMSGSGFRECDSQQRKAILKEKIQQEVPVGIIGYINQEPVGWCSTAPRETYGRLERSRSIKKIDDKNIWSVVCFFIKPDYQQQDYSLALLQGAVDYARSQGAEVVEGYPVEPRQGSDGQLNYNVSYRFMGYVSTFKKAGFRDVTPVGSSRIIMRYSLSEERMPS